MEFFRIKRDIPFMRHALVFNVISALTFVAAAASGRQIWPIEMRSSLRRPP